MQDLGGQYNTAAAVVMGGGACCLCQRVTPWTAIVAETVGACLVMRVRRLARVFLSPTALWPLRMPVVSTLPSDRRVFCAWLLYVAAVVRHGNHRLVSLSSSSANHQSHPRREAAGGATSFSFGRYAQAQAAPSGRPATRLCRSRAAWVSPTSYRARRPPSRAGCPSTVPCRRALHPHVTAGLTLSDSRGG